MKLNTLEKTTAKSKKRVGRGIGSGKGGHTSGRGQKGQKTRYDVPLLFQGSKSRKSLVKRLPMKKGKDRFKPHTGKALILNLKYLNLLPENSQVTVDLLIKAGLVDAKAKQYGVKILGDGELEKKMTVLLPASKSAIKKIEKAGGKVSAEAPKVKAEPKAKEAPKAKTEKKAVKKQAKPRAAKK